MPSYADVLLQLHCDGSDGATAFPDTSSYARTVTAVGNAQVDTARSVFGGASALFDGTGDRLSVPASTAFDFGTADLTVEAWVYISANSAPDADGARGAAVACAWGTGTVPGGWVLLIFGNTTATGTGLAFDTWSSTGAAATLYRAPVSVSQGAWHHVAATVTSGVRRLFLDGVEIAGSTTTVGAGYTSADSNGNTVEIGGTAVGPYPLTLDGSIDELRITDASWYAAGFTPTGPFPDSGDIIGRVSVAGPLGAPAVLGATLVSGPAQAPSPLGAALVVGRVSLICYAAAPSPLGAALVLGFHNFTGAVDGQPLSYVMDLTTPGGTVRVPISSWQATLRVEQSNYLQCVVRACLPYVDNINAATVFTILRRARLPDGSAFEYVMASNPLDDVSLAQGALNYSATLSGYSPGAAPDDDPPEATERTLQDVRTIYTQTSGLRVRCAIDWLLRPAQRAIVDGTPFIVSYINYYVTDGDQYMDVGELVAPA